MNAFVTGGNGFLGSYLVKELLKEGYRVTIFDINDNSNFLSQEEKKKINFFIGDLSNISHLFEAVYANKPSIIFHLGTMLSVPSDKDPQSAFNINAGGTFNLLEAARVFNVDKLIYSSSIAVYSRDIKETVIDDFTLQRPSNAYGIYKTFSELIGHYYYNKYGIDFRALRFSSIVGPGSRIKHLTVYNSWAIENSYYGKPYAIFVEPQIKCPVIYFRDAIQGLINLSKASEKNIKTRCYNLTGIELQAKDLADEIKKQLPQAKLTFEPEKEAMDFFWPLQKVTFDDSKAKEEWYFKLKYNLSSIVSDFCTILE